MANSNPSQERPRIYLDHAATSWPKDDAVLTAMDQFARQIGAAAGRGGYQSAMAADRIVATTRKRIANLINAESVTCVSLHSNGTTALNAAIHGVLSAGDHVVTNAAEHNSVLRPLHDLQQRGLITLSVVDCDEQGLVDTDRIMSAICPDTRLVTLTHASNVTGCVQPIAAVGSRLRELPTLFLCDAAQTFGCLGIDVQRWGIDMLAAPGHKGSGGPLGTGFLYVAESLHDQIRPVIQGGTGSQSESLEMPTTLPGKLEAGNLNVPALAGWNAALEITSRTLPQRIRQLSALSRHLIGRLSQIDGVHLYGHSRLLPIASLAIEGIGVADAAIVLDAEFGLETRAGLHCAALIHAYLGSAPHGGTLRISAGHGTTFREIDLAADAIAALCREVSGT
jgi:selenocysteine lyase/cysteine desulfurase